MGTFHHANRLDMAQQPSVAKTAQGRKPETRCKVEAADGQSQNGLSHNGHAASCTHSVLLPLLLVVLDKHFTGSLCMCSGTHAHVDRHLAICGCLLLSPFPRASASARHPFFRVSFHSHFSFSRSVCFSACCGRGEASFTEQRRTLGPSLAHFSWLKGPAPLRPGSMTFAACRNHAKFGSSACNRRCYRTSPTRCSQLAIGPSLLVPKLQPVRFVDHLPSVHLHVEHCSANISEQC